MNHTRKKEFINKARSKHGDKFDYSEVIYTNNKVPIDIICPEHGQFKQTPSGHLISKHGCPHCSHESSSILRTKDTKWFVEEARNVHGDRYSYVKSVYVRSDQPVIIGCEEHGDFHQNPNNHIRSKQGCPKCGIESARQIRSFKQEDVIEIFREVHGDKFDYSRVDYKNIDTKVIIVCPEHGYFEQTP